MSNQKSEPALPAGQLARADFPRFGLSRFATRFPTETQNVSLHIHGNLKSAVFLTEELTELERVEQISDFHCVTTWSKTGLHWSGYRFADFFNVFVASRVSRDKAVSHAVFHCQDGYRVSFLLEDLMRDNVLLADSLNQKNLGIDHGAPMRLVAPAHYGYKNAKHINGIEFLTDLGNYRPASLNFMEHPRARVALEERGKYIPGWILRYLYRPLIASAVKESRQALKEHLEMTPK